MPARLGRQKPPKSAPGGYSVLFEPARHGTAVPRPAAVHEAKEDVERAGLMQGCTPPPATPRRHARVASKSVIHHARCAPRAAGREHHARHALGKWSGESKDTLPIVHTACSVLKQPAPLQPAFTFAGLVRPGPTLSAFAPCGLRVGPVPFGPFAGKSSSSRLLPTASRRGVAKNR